METGIANKEKGMRAMRATSRRFSFHSESTLFTCNGRSYIASNGIELHIRVYIANLTRTSEVTFRVLAGGDGYFDMRHCYPTAFRVAEARAVDTMFLI